MRATTRLRTLLATKTPLVAPGCYNALTAKVLEQAGFPALYMTGYGTSLALLGLPDAGLATMGEMHLNARYIANAVGVPVIADADNGYGNAINVIRTVREYIQTGVAAIHLEDQVIPKRCGHVAGRVVVPIEEAVGKIRAADRVRRDHDPDFVLIARTDARGAHGGSLDEAIRRANAYLEAGADMAFVEGPTNVDEVRRVCREVKGPILYNQTGVSPRFGVPELAELGIAVAILPGALLRVTIQATYDFALALRDRVAEVLPAWADGQRHRALLLGMWAFGIEEAGDYARAEEVGRQAVERDPRDVWGIHAVAHSFEMRGRARDGLAYLAAREGDWAAGTALSVHNWWHHALFTLEAGDVDAVLLVHDTRIHHAASAGLAFELLDGAALLWRLWLDGREEPARWRALAAAWGPQVSTPFYAFNDLHAVMAWVGAGDVARAEALIADRERWLAEPRPGVSNYTMTARIGLPACRAAVAFGAGRFADALALLYPIRHHLNEFGGSHAQRDVLHRTILECALRAGQYDLAAALVAERLHVKPDSPWNLRQQARVASARGAASNLPLPR